jgi:sec-independent protein translocase protein TatA
VEALAFIGGLSPSEMVIVLILGLLLFGSRLPQVGRSIGKSLAEFKRGLRGFENEMESAEKDIERQLDVEEAEAKRKKALPALPEVEEKTKDEAQDRRL